MKEKVSFWTYFRAMNFGVPVKMGSLSFFEAFIPTFVLFIFLDYLGGHALPFLCIIAIVAPSAIAINFSMTKVNPSLFSLLPMGRKRRTAYFFLSILFTIVISVAMIVLFFTLISLLILLIAAMGDPNGVHFDTSESVRICLQGQLFALCLIFLLSGAEMIGMTIKNKAARRAVVALFPILVVVVLKLIMHFCGIQNGDLFLLFNTIPQNSVYLIVFGSLGLVLTVLGVIRAVKFLRPKEF